MITSISFYGSGTPPHVVMVGENKNGKIVKSINLVSDMVKIIYKDGSFRIYSRFEFIANGDTNN